MTRTALGHEQGDPRRARPGRRKGRHGQVRVDRPFAPRCRRSPLRVRRTRAAGSPGRGIPDHPGQPPRVSRRRQPAGRLASVPAVSLRHLWPTRCGLGARATAAHAAQSAPRPWSALRWIARRTDPRTWLTASRQLAGHIDRHRRLESFAACCDQLFQRVILTDGDQVFLPTLSDFDLHGLVRFLARSPGTRAATWHLQFHFDILAGRPPQYRDQLDRLATSREHFQSALDQVPHHRLCLYSTTPQMAATVQLVGRGTLPRAALSDQPGFPPARPAPPRRPPAASDLRRV